MQAKWNSQVVSVDLKLDWEEAKSFLRQLGVSPRDLVLDDDDDDACGWWGIGEPGDAKWCWCAGNLRIVFGWGCPESSVRAALQ